MRACVSVCVYVCVRVVAGVQVRDRYLILQTHNPKRMFKPDKSEKGGGDEAEEESEDQGAFIHTHTHAYTHMYTHAHTHVHICGR